jgi:hypothetical protein
MGHITEIDKRDNTDCRTNTSKHESLFFTTLQNSPKDFANFTKLTKQRNNNKNTGQC